MQSSIVQKLMLVLTTISAAQEPLPFSAVVKKTGLNKSTIHRILALAVAERLVWYDSNRKTYMLGSRVFDLVRNAYDGFDIQAIALDEMLRLFETFDANVTLGVLSGMEVVYLRVLESPLTPGVQRPGLREPVHCSASGKALLAYLPQKVLDARLKDYAFTRFTDRTITDAADFQAALAFVRSHGFGKNDREEFDHFLGISAPVFNFLGDPIAVLNIWSSFPRHSIADLIGWSDALKDSAATVTRMIGGQVPADPGALPGSDGALD